MDVQNGWIIQFRATICWSLRNPKLNRKDRRDRKALKFRPTLGSLFQRWQSRSRLPNCPLWHHNHPRKVSQLSHTASQTVVMLWNQWHLQETEHAHSSREWVLKGKGFSQKPKKFSFYNKLVLGFDVKYWTEPGSDVMALKRLRDFPNWSSPKVPIGLSQIFPFASLASQLLS